MSLWQVDICWLVAFLRLSILYLHPYHLPSFNLRASQFRAISPLCIQGGPVVCQNNGDPDQNYSRQCICEWWWLCFVTSFLSPAETVEWRVTKLVAVLASNWFPANGECSQIVTSIFSISLLQIQKECSALVVQNKKDILFSRTKNNCKKIPTCLLKLQGIVNIDAHKCKNWRTLLAWQTALHKLPSGSITEIAHNCRVRRPSQHSGGEIS